MIKEIKNYAIKYDIPIIEDDSLEYILKYIKEKNIKNILEIGSAIGYSAINMALVHKDIKIVTIERDISRYNKALEYIKKFNLEGQITIINDDAFNIDLKEKFDLIFIDAAKGQSIKFFNKFEKNCLKTIITDNIYFHGLTYSENIKSKNLRKLTEKIKDYVDFLNDNKEFITKIIDVGDGLSVSSRSCL